MLISVMPGQILCSIVTSDLIYCGKILLIIKAQFITSITDLVLIWYCEDVLLTRGALDNSW